MILTILLHGCVLPVGEDTAARSSTDELYGAGQLSDADFTLDWWLGEAWAEGACVELVLTNQGADRSDWLATVGLSEGVENWIDGYGGLTVTNPSPDEISLMPSGGIAAGASVQASFCAEPLTEPSSLLVFAADAEGSEDTGDEPAEEAPITGAFYTPDEAWGLSYQGGAEHGSTDAECLLLKLWNFSGEDASGWHAAVTFSAPPVVSYSWSVQVFADQQDPDTVHLYGIHGLEDIAAGATAEAGLCLAPMVEPLSMTVTVE